MNKKQAFERLKFYKEMKENEMETVETFLKDYVYGREVLRAIKRLLRYQALLCLYNNFLTSNLESLEFYFGRKK